MKKYYIYYIPQLQQIGATQEKPEIVMWYKKIKEYEILEEMWGNRDDAQEIIEKWKIKKDIKSKITKEFRDGNKKVIKTHLLKVTRGDYVRGMKQGIWVEYDHQKNYWRGSYDMGVPFGEWKYYSKDGKYIGSNLDNNKNIKDKWNKICKRLSKYSKKKQKLPNQQ